MAEIAIYMRHQAVVSTEMVKGYSVTGQVQSHEQHVAECPCGWREKGYSDRDCQGKANDHCRTASDVVLLSPQTIRGRWRWPSS